MGRPQKHEPLLSVDEFLAWYERQPEGSRYELLDGVIYQMQSERAVHGLIKGNIYASFRQQVRNLGLPCQVFVDGMAVRIEPATTFEPDVFIRCGKPVPDELTAIADPMIVVEIASPSTKKIDETDKLTRYFDNPHILHYLVVLPLTKAVTHHHRDATGQIKSETYHSGAVILDPLGIKLELAETFER